MIIDVLLVAMMIIAGLTAWVVRLLVELRRLETALVSGSAAMEAADKTLGFYQTILLDVATGQATLEVDGDGYVVATHRSADKTSGH